MVKRKMKKETKTFIIIQILAILIFILSCLSIRLNWIRFLPECAMRNKFDLYCPSCGVTRMGVSLYKFNIKEAFLYNPVFFCILIYITIMYIAYVLSFFLKRNMKIFKWWHVIVWGVIIIIFTIIRNIV